MGQAYACLHRTPPGNRCSPLMPCSGSWSISACSLAASWLNASSPALFPFLLVIDCPGRIAELMPNPLLDLILGIVELSFVLIRIDHVFEDRRDHERVRIL